VAVYQRTSEKGTLLWCADFVGPKVGGGTRRYRLALGIDVKTKAQAKAAEARLRVDLEEEVNRGPSSPASVAPDDPVRVLAERWYAHNVAVGAWKPSTAKLYRTILDGWLLPDVGAVPLDSLDALRIDGFKASIANRGRGEKWNKSVLGVLAAMLAQIADPSRGDFRNVDHALLVFILQQIDEDRIGKHLGDFAEQNLILFREAFLGVEHIFCSSRHSLSS